MFKKLIFFMATGALIALLCSPLWAQDIIPNNHFKAYSISPKPFSFSAFTKDQFMEDGLSLMGPILLTNPVQKDTFSIIDTTHHLHWYFAQGRDTLIQVNYENQFETTTVSIDSVRFLLVPAQKFPHNPPQNLDHYKCYRIRESQWLQKKPVMADQFVPTEGADSVRRDLFCTPCQKNAEPTFDTITHYVAYLIAPGQPLIPPFIVQAQDQFSLPGVWVDTVMGSKYLLVPTIKNLPPPPCDTGNNHYKVWLLNSQTVSVPPVQVKDQFMTDILDLPFITFLANPVTKIVGTDTTRIVDPDDHLTWYKASGTKDTLIGVEYKNQFESTTVVIDSVKWLLVPTTKLPHDTFDCLDHYKCYYIRNPQWMKRPHLLQDQFDLPNFEQIDSLLPVYFCAPCTKNGSPQFDTLTHYVAYYFAEPAPPTPPSPRVTEDQFGMHSLNFIGPWGLLVPTEKLSSGPPAPDTGKNHYKTWRLQPVPFTATPQVKDQFMTDTLDIVQLDFLSNPVRKIVFGPVVNDTFNIIDPDDHLTWYRATGRDTLLKVGYANQFETTSVVIDSVQYLLVPAQKDGHPPFDSLDHYKAYRIRNPQLLNRPVELNDQFDLSPENITSFVPVFFLTPCQKNSGATFDTITHYVAYSIAPIMGYSGLPRTITDQFFPTPGRTVDVLHSELLLVPTLKQQVTAQEACCFPDGSCALVDAGTCPGIVVPACLGDLNGNGIDDACEPPPSDTGPNHFKTWRIQTIPVTSPRKLVKDQFMQDTLSFISLDFLSNPVRKIVQNDTFGITDPDEHLNWYRVFSNKVKSRLTGYMNQFESTTVTIDTVKYLLVPAQKISPFFHNPPESLDHYKAYRIKNGPILPRQVLLDDQFDFTTEQITTIQPVYFLTPAQKESEPRYDTVTHYVAYLINPQSSYGSSAVTVDQFAVLGPWNMSVMNSEMLLVPTKKLCTAKPGDADNDTVYTLADVIAIVNYVFKKPGWPFCPANNYTCWLYSVPCSGDWDGDSDADLADVIRAVNYIFKKPGWPFCPANNYTCWLPIPYPPCCIKP